MTKFFNIMNDNVMCFVMNDIVNDVPFLIYSDSTGFV